MVPPKPMVQPKKVDLTPTSVHVEWDDGHVSDYPARYLRGSCRCAGCVNELSGRRMVGVQQVPADVQALDWMILGRYALQFLWSDGHDTGIYPYVALRDDLCPCDFCKARRGELR